MNRLPLAIRAMLAVDRAVRQGQTLVSRVREETFLNWVPPRLRECVTFHIYEQYSPQSTDKNGLNYPREIFTWEQELFTAAPFPTQGRILLGAAGSGRELAWLADRGYEILAFEPSGLVDEAAKIAAGRANIRVERASYRDLVGAIECNEGPLGQRDIREEFDAIILGWGSLSHVCEPADRARLLKALHRRWPQAPVFASFFMRRGDSEDSVPLRLGLRRFFSVLRAPGRPSSGLRYFHESGFAYAFTLDEITSLAADSGYSVLSLHKAPYPHAVFL